MKLSDKKHIVKNIHLIFKTISNAFWYILIQKRLIGFFSSAMILPLMKITIKIGTIVTDKIAPISIANVLVKARGLKSLSSCPLKANIGKNEITIIINAKNMGLPTCLALESIMDSLLH